MARVHGAEMKRRSSHELSGLAGEANRDSGSNDTPGNPRTTVVALVDPGSVTPALEALRMAKKLNAHSKTARIALEPWLGCWPRCSVNFRFSQNCSPIAPTPDQSSILRSARSCPTSKPKSSDAQIVPKGSCRYPSVGSSNVRSLG